MTKSEAFKEINETQDEYIEQLIQLMNNPNYETMKQLNFTSPTGTGKTNMMSKLINKFPNYYFIITTLSKGQLHKQIRSNLEKLCNNDNFYVYGSADYKINSKLDAEDIIGKIPKNTKCIWLRDEGHIRTNRFDALLEKVCYKVINFSATNSYSDIQCNFAHTMMLRTVNQTSGTPEDAIQKLLEIKKSHKKVKDYNPCAIFRVTSNDKKFYHDLIELCYKYKLKYIDITTEIFTMSELCEDNNEYDVIINRYKIVEGIDIRRAHVLYMDNQPGNNATTIQVIGRCRRNALLYRNDIDIFSKENEQLLKDTRECYVYYNVENMKVDTDENGELQYAFCNYISCQALKPNTKIYVENGQLSNGLYVIELKGETGEFNIEIDKDIGFNIVSPSTSFYKESQIIYNNYIFIIYNNSKAYKLTLEQIKQLPIKTTKRCFDFSIGDEKFIECEPYYLPNRLSVENIIMKDESYNVSKYTINKFKEKRLQYIEDLKNNIFIFDKLSTNIPIVEDITIDSFNINYFKKCINKFIYSKKSEYTILKNYIKSLDGYVDVEVSITLENGEHARYINLKNHLHENTLSLIKYYITLLKPTDENIFKKILNNELQNLILLSPINQLKYIQTCWINQKVFTIENHLPVLRSLINNYNRLYVFEGHKLSNNRQINTYLMNMFEDISTKIFNISIIDYLVSINLVNDELLKIESKLNHNIIPNVIPIMSWQKFNQLNLRSSNPNVYNIYSMIPIDIISSAYNYKEYNKIINDKESALIGVDLMHQIKDEDTKQTVWVESKSVSSKIGNYNKFNEFLSMRYKQELLCAKEQYIKGKNDFKLNKRCNSVIGYIVEYYSKYLVYGEPYIAKYIKLAQKESKTDIKNDFIIIRACMLKYKDMMIRSFGQGVSKVIKTISIEQLIKDDYKYFCELVMTLGKQTAKFVKQTLYKDKIIQDNIDPNLSINHISGLADYITEDTILDVKVKGGLGEGEVKQVLAYHYLSTKRSDLHIKRVIVYDATSNKAIVIPISKENQF